MLDIEYLTEVKQIKQSVLYSYDCPLFLSKVESRLFQWVKDKKFGLVELTPDNAIQELGTSSLFGEKFCVLKIENFPKEYLSLIQVICKGVVEKSITTRLYVRAGSEASLYLKEDPQWIAFSKASTHLEQTPATKAHLKKLLPYFQKTSGYSVEPSNPDVLIRSLEGMIQQDDDLSTPQALEVLWKRLDMIFALCFKGKEFDLALFNKYIRKDPTKSQYFRMHEIIHTLCVSKKDTSSHAIQQLVLELDALRFLHDNDSRMALSKIIYAIKDLLLVNQELGCISENSPHMSKFKRQKILPLGACEPMQLVGLLSLLMENEQLYRNSDNLALDLQILMNTRFFPPVKKE